MTKEVLHIHLQSELQKDQLFVIQPSMTMGSNLDCDITLKEMMASPVQGKLHLNQDKEVVTYTHVGTDGTTIINQQECLKGKTYILDVGDTIIIGHASLRLVLKEKLPSVPPPPSENDQIDNEFTLSGIPLQELKKEETASLNHFDEDEEEAGGDTLVGIEVLYPEDIPDNIEELNKKKSLSARKPAPKVPEGLKELPGLQPQKKKKPATKRKAPRKKAKIELKEQKVGSKRSGRSQGHVGDDQVNYKKKASKERTSDAASAVPRVLGQLYNVLFFTLSYFYTNFFDNSVVKDLAQAVNSALAPLYSVLPSFFDYILPPEKIRLTQYLLSLLLWNMVTSLILGLNLGQFLVGLSAQGNALAVRLTAPLRVLLGLVTGPLLVLDLPCLVGSRTLKEKVTGVTTVTRSTLLTVLSSALVLPVLFLTLANYQFVDDAGLFKHVTEQDKQGKVIDVVQAKKKRLQANSKKALKVAIEPLNIQIQTQIPAHFFMYPYMTKNPAYNHLKFLIYDQRDGQSITWQNQQVILAQEIGNFMDKDPMFVYKHPNFFKNFSDSDQQNTILMNKIYSVLTLSSDKFISYIADYGFFLKPHFDFIKFLQRKIGIGHFGNIHLLKNGDRSFIRFNQMGIENKTYLLATNELGLALYTIDNENANDLMVSDVLEFILAYTRPYKAGSEEEGLSLESLLGKIAREAKLEAREATFIVKTYTDLGRQLIQGSTPQQEKHLELLLGVFKNNERALLKAVKKSNDKNISELRLALNRIQKALYKREIEFFQINP